MEPILECRVMGPDLFILTTCDVRYRIALWDSRSIGQSLILDSE